MDQSQKEYGMEKAGGLRTQKNNIKEQIQKQNYLIIFYIGSFYFLILLSFFVQF